MGTEGDLVQGELDLWQYPREYKAMTIFSFKSTDKPFLYVIIWLFVLVCHGLVYGQV